MTASGKKDETPKKETKKEPVSVEPNRYSSMRFFDPRLGVSKNQLPGRMIDAEDMTSYELATEMLVKLGIAEKHSGLIPGLSDAIEWYMLGGK